MPARIAITALLALSLILMPGLGMKVDLTYALADGQVRQYGFRVVNTYPHDINAFTQGLKFHQGFIYEGTGQYGLSSLSRINLESGEVLQRKSMPSRYFGEGIEIVGDRIFQLTWRSHRVFVHDLETFEARGVHYNPTEGWGLAWDGEFLILSDGSAVLRFLDPDSLATRKRIQVMRGGRPVDKLNELEFIEGEVWANVWGSDEIMRINPVDGQVTGVVDLTGLSEKTKRGSREAVLNGIAWDAKSRRLFVTGKHWGNLFEIELVSKGGAD